MDADRLFLAKRVQIPSPEWDTAFGAIKRAMLSTAELSDSLNMEMMLERQRDGIAKAKEEGKYKGRKATARAKSVEVARLLAEGKTKEAIAAELGIGVASVYRISKDLKVTGGYKIRNEISGSRGVLRI